ncbi:MAG: adenylosuccinate lyase [Candidatus Izemoplasmatales bacterium]|jgi:adenylosuccinate lyase|nr:adenylosuccinate lyase [Candidatus Izemoplasmatales bacterium]
MIDRYARKPLTTIWSDRTKFETYLQIEILNVEALFQKGLVLPSELELIHKNASFSMDDIIELENELKHDVIAFTRSVSNSLGAEKRWIHYGLTSTDIVDTANGVRLQKVNEIIYQDIIAFMAVLKKQAEKYKDTYCIGRTHGIHADITIFGLKWALWYDEMNRNLHRFLEVRKEVEIGKISGAVGNYAFIDPSVEEYICRNLGIDKAKISTQTLQRDRYAHYISVIALIGASLEKIATEIRHLQRTEVSEVKEPFSQNQKGSSAMPHKKNPISSENITGLSRVLRGYIIPMFEDVSLWHERDISHSSVERIVLPDATCLIDYMLNRYAYVLENLIVDETKMLENIYITKGIIFSQRVLTALIDKGLSREDAYDLTQQLTTYTYDHNLNFIDVLKQDKQVKQFLDLSTIENCFTLEFYKEKRKYIYAQVFTK